MTKTIRKIGRVVSFGRRVGMTPFELACESVSAALSTDETRPHLTAVRCEGMRVHATDGHRIHVRRLAEAAPIGWYSTTGKPVERKDKDGKLIKAPPIDDFLSEQWIGGASDQMTLPSAGLLSGVLTAWGKRSMGCRLDLESGKVFLVAVRSSSDEKRDRKRSLGYLDGLLRRHATVDLSTDYVRRPNAPAVELRYLVDAMTFTGATGLHFNPNAECDPMYLADGDPRTAERVAVVMPVRR